MQANLSFAAFILAALFALPILSLTLAALFAMLRESRTQAARKRGRYANRYMQAKAEAAQRYTARRTNHIAR